MTIIFAEEVQETRWRDNSVRTKKHYEITKLTTEMVGNPCGQNHTETNVVVSKEEYLPSNLHNMFDGMWCNLEGNEESLLNMYWIAKAIYAFKEKENPIPCFTDVIWVE